MPSKASEITVEANSLEEARAQLKDRVPEGQAILSENVVSDGRPQKCTGVAETVEAATAQARSKVPAGAEILNEMTIMSPARKTVEVQAFDEHAAMEQVKFHREVPKMAKIEALSLKAPGRKGFLGIGRTPNTYEASVLQQGVVEVRTENYITLTF